MSDWAESAYTGLFTRFGRVPSRPHDPEVTVWSGTIPPWGARDAEIHVGGAGWEDDAARGACIGEAVERLMPFPMDSDRAVDASFEDWPLGESAVPPDRWVLFHADQYARPGFPFIPLTRSTRVRWSCFREALSGEPRWVPEDLAFLFLPPDRPHRIAPAISTGLSCGRPSQPVLLRGVQEAVERDAVMGAWWGRYPLEEWEAGPVLDSLGEGIARRLQRPNLRYRLYRVDTPLSAHVTLATLEGEERAGWCFSAGSACRESRAASWTKSLLEAVHGYRYVRHLNEEEPETAREDPPTTFAAHAAWYSRHPDLLDRTVLHRAVAPSPADAPAETLHTLIDRLGPERPVLFRAMTPPGIASVGLDWHVLRVVVPGLQPLHGDHRLPQLGGPLWAPRRGPDWDAIPPHPFP